MAKANTATTSSGAKVPTPAVAEKVDPTNTEAVTAANAEAGATGDQVRQEHGISPAATAEQVMANGGVDTIDHTASGVAAPDVPAAPDLAELTTKATGKLVTGRVLAGITFSGIRYVPNDLLEGIPESLAKQHEDSIDTHAEAVAFARAQGYPVKQFGD